MRHPLAAGQRHHRVHVQHPRAHRVERARRPGHVGHQHVVDLAGEAGWPAARRGVCRVGGARPARRISVVAPTAWPPPCAPPSRLTPGQADAAGRPRRPAGRRSRTEMLLPDAAGARVGRGRCTGTSARTEAPAVTGSPRVIIQPRSAPATTASTTSLTVPPCAARTRPVVGQRRAGVANRRCSPIDGVQRVDRPAGARRRQRRHARSTPPITSRASARPARAADVEHRPRPPPRLQRPRRRPAPAPTARRRAPRPRPRSRAARA